MKKHVKRKWLKALKSGQYRKARKVLRRSKPNRFCCLGVLCDISGQGNWKTVGAYETRSDFDEYQCPREVLKWSHLEYSEMEILMGLNDNRRGWDAVIKFIKEKL